MKIGTIINRNGVRYVFLGYVMRSAGGKLFECISARDIETGRRVFVRRYPPSEAERRKRQLAKNQKAWRKLKIRRLREQGLTAEEAAAVVATEEARRDRIRKRTRKIRRGFGLSYSHARALAKEINGG